MSYLDTTALEAFSKSQEAAEAVKKATDSGQISGDHFTGMTVPDEGIFKTKTPASIIETAPLTNKFDALKGQKDHLKYLEDGKYEASLIDAQKKVVEAAEKDIATHLEQAYPSMVASKNHHATAANQLKTAEGKALAEANKLHATERATLSDPQLIADADKKLAETKKAIEDHFKPLKEVHDKHIEGVDKITKELESKGFESKKFMSAKSVEKLGGTERSFVKSIGADIKSNAMHGGAWKKAQVVLGGIGMIDAGRRILRAATGSTDPEKADNSRLADLVIGGAEAAAAIAVMRMGGSKVVARS